MVLVGEIGVGKFDVAEVSENTVHFKDWNKIDMDKGSIVCKGIGVVDDEDDKGNITDGCMWVLSSAEIKKVEQIKNKIKILDNLKEKEKNKNGKKR